MYAQELTFSQRSMIIYSPHLKITRHLINMSLPVTRIKLDFTQGFRSLFWKKVTVIIDGFEVFINRPSGLYVSTQTIFLLQEPLYCKVFDWNHTSRQYFFCFQSMGWKNIRQIPTTRRFSFSRSWFYHTKVLSSIRPNYLFQHSQEGKTCWTQ